IHRPEDSGTTPRRFRLQATGPESAPTAAEQAAGQPARDHPAPWRFPSFQEPAVILAGQLRGSINLPRETPNAKAPNAKKNPRAKISNNWTEDWSFGFIWRLEFGIWDLAQGPLISPMPRIPIPCIRAIRVIRG